MTQKDNINENVKALLAQKEETSKKLKTLHEELNPLMLQNYNSSAELEKINELLIEESKLINEDYQLSLKLLDSLGETIKAFDEELEKL